MRKYLVSAISFVLIGPIAYLAWTGLSYRAIAQVGVNSTPSPPIPATPTTPAQTPSGPSNAELAQQVQQLQRAVQALQAQPHSGWILPDELAAAPDDPTVVVAGNGAALAKIEAALVTETEIDATDVPLNVVINQLKARHKIEIQLDTAALKDVGVEPDVHVTKHVRAVSLRSALRMLMSDLQLRYIIYNEVLLITSFVRADSDECFMTRFYPVKDLILVRNEQGAIEADFESLKEVITQTIGSKSWEDNGGAGTMSEFQLRGRCLLVVTQTEDVHELITDFFAGLRKAGVTGGKQANNLLLPVRIGRPQPMGNFSAGGGTMGGGM